jgi:hypothetical protein
LSVDCVDGAEDGGEGDSGRDIIGTCEAATWLMTEAARWAMNSWVAGGMA